MKQIFIRNHPAHAGYWIYRGYVKAWESHGYKVHLYDDITEVPSRANGHDYETPHLPCYLPGNGGLLSAVAMMAGGFTGPDGSTSDVGDGPSSAFGGEGGGCQPWWVDLGNGRRSWPLCLSIQTHTSILLVSLS